ncbi:hypothetical protein Aduo_003692 [Ancylostoma duodenale]
MRSLLLLVLLAGGGLFVSAFIDELAECLTCGHVVSVIAEGHKEDGCRALQKNNGDLVPLCRRIFKEVENKDLYDDIHAAVKSSYRWIAVPRALKYCNKGFSKKYCSVGSILWSMLPGTN